MGHKPCSLEVNPTYDQSTTRSETRSLPTASNLWAPDQAWHAVLQDRAEWFTHDLCRPFSNVVSSSRTILSNHRHTRPAWRSWEASNPFTIPHSLKRGCSPRPVCPEGLIRGGSRVGNHVCDRKQAGVLAVNQTASFYFLSLVLSPRVCVSQLFRCLSFFFFFSSPRLSLKSDKQKDFHLLQRRKISEREA